MSILNGAGFVADAIGSVSSYLMNEQSAETSRKWQAEQNRQQQIWQSAENQRSRDWEEKMWNMSNAYNTPSAQRARLREAGFSPWQSGGGGAGVTPNLAASHGSPSAGSPSMVGAPSFPIIDNPADNMQSVLNESIRIDAESANQLAQAAQSAVMTSVALYEKTGDLKSAEKYLNTSLRAVGGASFNDNSLYFRQFELSIRAKELENINKDLNNQYQKIQNDIQAKTGMPLAEANLSNIRQSTAFLGKQIEEAVSRIDLNKENILNAKETRKLIESQIKSALSEVVANYANAYRLRKEGDKFVADTQTINAVREHVVKSAKYAATKAVNEAAVSYDIATESRAHLVQRENARNWMISDEGKNNALGNQKLNDDKYRNAVGSSIQIVDDLLHDLFIPMSK